MRSLIGKLLIVAGCMLLLPFASSCNQAPAPSGSLELSEPLTVPTVRMLPTMALTPGPNTGSFTLKILREFKRSAMDISCEAEFLVVIATDPADPAGTVVAMGQGTGVCSIYILGVGTAGSHETTADIPVDYGVWGIFIGTPACAIELSIDENIRYSETPVIHNTLLGDIPATDLDMGADSSTTFDIIHYDIPVLNDPMIATIESPDTISVFTIKYLSLPGFTACQPYH
jgi:hypothetical protein